MTTAKSKVKRMMLGGVASHALNTVKQATAAKTAPMKMQNAARSAAAQTAFKPAPKQFMSDALRSGAMKPPSGRMKKGGAVKKATKK